MFVSGEVNRKSKRSLCFGEHDVTLYPKVSTVFDLSGAGNCKVTLLRLLGYNPFSSCLELKYRHCITIADPRPFDYLCDAAGELTTIRLETITDDPSIAESVRLRNESESRNY